MAIEATERIWMHDQLVPWESAIVHVMTHAHHYGSFIFQGIRAYRSDADPCVFRLDAHNDRLFDSAAIEVGTEVGTDACVSTRQRIAPDMIPVLANAGGSCLSHQPVRSVDRATVRAGRPGPNTQRLQKAFFGLFEGPTPDCCGWLDAARAEVAV